MIEWYDYNMQQKYNILKCPSNNDTVNKETINNDIINIDKMEEQTDVIMIECDDNIDKMEENLQISQNVIESINMPPIHLNTLSQKNIPENPQQIIINNKTIKYTKSKTNELILSSNISDIENINIELLKYDKEGITLPEEDVFHSYDYKTRYYDFDESAVIRDYKQSIIPFIEAKKIVSNSVSISKSQANQCNYAIQKYTTAKNKYIMYKSVHIGNKDQLKDYFGGNNLKEAIKSYYYYIKLIKLGAKFLVGNEVEMIGTDDCVGSWSQMDNDVIWSIIVYIMNEVGTRGVQPLLLNNSHNIFQKLSCVNPTYSFVLIQHIDLY